MEKTISTTCACLSGLRLADYADGHAAISHETTMPSRAESGVGRCGKAALPTSSARATLVAQEKPSERFRPLAVSR